LIEFENIIEDHKNRYRDELIWICGLVSTDGNMTFMKKTGGLNFYIVHSAEIDWIHQIRDILYKNTLFETVIVKQSFKNESYPRVIYKIRLKNVRYFAMLSLGEIGRKYMINRKYLIMEEWFNNSKVKQFTPLEDEFLLINSDEKVEKISKHLNRDRSTINRRRNQLGIYVYNI
jgi:hypothetical protein